MDVQEDFICMHEVTFLGFQSPLPLKSVLEKVQFGVQ